MKHPRRSPQTDPAKPAEIMSETPPKTRNQHERKPEWLRARPAGGRAYHEIKKLLRRQGLHTVCENAACPNRGECFSSRTATFLLLGHQCSRACTFCNIGHGPVSAADQGEPRRVAKTVAELNLEFAVVTSVTRDDLPDGGAAHIAATIRWIKRLNPGCGVEVLIPDFGGDPLALEKVLAARPEVLNHNLETVPRLYRTVRPQADYRRSLQLLRRARQWAAAGLSSAGVKTGIMVGLGESADEVVALMADCAAAGVSMLTIGQYLQPTDAHHPVIRFWTPAEFTALAAEGRRLGIAHIEAGPLVRSSYRARELASVGGVAGSRDRTWEIGS
jgi:lipoic acid synthetase